MSDEASEVALAVAKEQEILLARLRRRTTMSDEEIVKTLLPFSEAAFEAGYRMAMRDASERAAHLLRYAALYRSGFLIVSAAVVAWLVAAR